MKYLQENNKSKLSEEQRKSLDDPISISKLIEVKRKQKAQKASGPDIYQWNIIRNWKMY